MLYQWADFFIRTYAHKSMCAIWHDKGVQQDSPRVVILIFVLKFNTYRQPTWPVWVEPHEKQIPSLGILFQVTIPLEGLVGYREISGKHLRFCGGTSSGVTAQNILISRLSIQERYLLSHSGVSPLATIRIFRFNELNPKGLSWRPHFVQFWCGRAICQHVPNTTKHCGCQRKALWLQAQGIVVETKSRFFLR